MSPEASESSADNESEIDSPPFPIWKKGLLVLALLLFIAGGALYLMTPEKAQPDMPPPISAQSTGPGAFAPHSFAPDNGIDPTQWQGGSIPGTTSKSSTQPELNDWSVFMMKLGFSFFIGFSMGYALAGFAKLTFFITGVLALVLFGLQYVGLIQVNWSGMEGIYNDFIAWLQPQIGSFKDFVTSNLSSSGMAAAGLVVGFKK
ncbi:FUN14 domain-containing protein [Candidatus Venteria ishoeyi]|uniref:FUN14 domain-containing protein n=1 Tax=Candidatus Venteria ishoeyi TaxID=1899563 RepID=UPI0025A68B14|nr:FUN14 domain-containing protein [Candidatus Venteria ishoeyi]MDM8545548.1 FUN14 domain-containing protein [Candidatus Venteria ishoeyi]